MINEGPAHPLRRLAGALLVALLLTVATACAGSDDGPVQRLTPDIGTRVQGLTYYSGEGVKLKADACLPSGEQQNLHAVILVHGGAFIDGSRDEGGMDALCELIASYGIAAFPIDYRFAPDFRYPAQVNDVGHAVRWLRAPAQVEKFGLDPDHIGVVGSSAGAILAQSIGTRGKGSLTKGTRVSAVVSLSGVSVMTPEGLALGDPSTEAQALISNYLGCESVTTDCPQSEPASPITDLDRSDAAMLLVNGSNELVPQQQAATMADALEQRNVPHQVIIVDGDYHGVALLNADVRRSIQSFLDKNL